MADSSKNFEKTFYPNLYNVLDTLKEEMAARNESLEAALVLNKVLIDTIMIQQYSNKHRLTK